MQTLFLIKMSNFEIQRKVVSNSKNNLPISNNYLKNSNIHFCISNISFVYFIFFQIQVLFFDLVISQNSFGCQRITLNFKN